MIDIENGIKETKRNLLTFIMFLVIGNISLDNRHNGIMAQKLMVMQIGNGNVHFI